MLKNQKDIIVIPMDDLGNRTTVNLRSGVNQVYATDTPNLTNRYTAVDSDPLVYDAAGNLTQDHDGYRYVYDYENRITRIFKLNGQTEIDVAQYTYDALGRRVEKKVYSNGQLSYFCRYTYNDQWQILEEVRTWPGYEPAVCTYLYGNYIDETVSHCWATPGGSLRRYLLHDHLYSPVALLSDVGVILQRYEYDAYGWRLSLTSAFAPTTLDYGNDTAFTGRQLDTLDDGALHHMHYRHRDYSPQLGRFLQQDPLNYIDVMNLYEYTLSSPILYLDPSGLTAVHRKIPPVKEDEDMVDYISRQCWARLICDGNVSPSKVQTAGFEAERFGREAGMEYGQDVNKRRAMQHCVASGSLAGSVGCDSSECLGTAREDFQQETGLNTPIDAQIGRNNNKIGRACAGCGGKNANIQPGIWMPGVPFPVYVKLPANPGKDDIKQCCRKAIEEGKADLGEVISSGPVRVH